MPSTTTMMSIGFTRRLNEEKPLMEPIRLRSILVEKRFQIPGVLPQKDGQRTVAKAMDRLLVTGSSGLIGSEVVTFFCEQGWKVFGVDNNMRADFFGAQGDTRWNRARLQAA